MAHVHSHAHAGDIPLSTRRWLAVAAATLAAATIAGVFVFRPGDGEDRPNLSVLGTPSEFYDAVVTDIDPFGCVQSGGGIPCDAVSFLLQGGPDEGATIELEFPRSPSTPSFGEGDDVVLSYSPESPEGFRYQFADRQREPVLVWLALIFAVAVVVLGRLRGLAALVGLVASIAVLLSFVLPAIIDGRSPIGVAVTGAALISFLALYLAHGIGPMTTVALLGTLGSLALTAILAALFLELAQFSGFASEEAIFLQAAGSSIDLQGLILAGVIIGALGALDDMTVTQASAVAELRAANPGMPTRDVLAAGLRIGRDHVASTVNTLVLAYAGASMPLLVLFVLSEQSLGNVANSELVATEIVRTLVGSVGLVAAVPITTWLAVVVGVGRRGGTGPAAS